MKQGDIKNMSLSSWRHSIPVVCGVIVCTIAVLTLLGWAFDLSLLKSWGQNLHPMKANSAVGLLLLGMALIHISLTENSHGVSHISTWCAILAGLTGLATIAEYGFGISLGIDELIARDDPFPIETAVPGRMAPITAICLMLSASALIALQHFRSRWSKVVDALFLTSSLIALFVVLGYVYDFGIFRNLGLNSSMALNTAAGFLMVASGGLFVQPARRLLGALIASTPAGTMLRWILPTAIGVPVLVGFLNLKGQDAGLYSTSIGVALSSVCTIALLFGLSVKGARVLDRVDSHTRTIEDEARTTNRQLKTFLEYTPNIVYMKDIEGRFLLANRHLEELLGVEPGRLVGTTVYDFYPDEIAQRYAKSDLDVIRAGAPITSEQSAFFGDENQRVFLSSKFPILDENGAVIGMGWTSTDITERKKAEEEITRLLSEVNSQNHQLLAANQELEAFSYSVSHDLRTPLRSIDGFSKAFLEDYGDSLEDQGRDQLNRVRAAAQQMGILIDDLLKLSKVTRADFSPELVNLSKLADSIAIKLKNKWPNRKITFQAKPNVLVDGDSRLLALAMENLLTNAFKYTSRKSTACIEFGSYSGDEGEVYFIKDDGVGFDMAYADKLFSAFERLHSVEEFEGTGIGLATVKRIICRHGGSVWAESIPGCGATFFFTLQPVTQEVQDAGQDHFAGRR